MQKCVTHQTKIRGCKKLSTSDVMFSHIEFLFGKLRMGALWLDRNSQKREKPQVIWVKFNTRKYLHYQVNLRKKFKNFTYRNAEIG